MTDIRGPIEKVMPNYETVIEALLTTLIEPTILNGEKDSPIPSGKRISDNRHRDPAPIPLIIGPRRSPPA